ncbi:zinc knuckle CX2CX4HX4C containing protein [Tanacetum coccineum]|uniref:Zinc knuckle CX2CX4HX4C containing protein n=1 Tax=Tanacetum coccineum TaxID=301880 RepID=A0ABQ4YNJ5_9ASTR
MLRVFPITLTGAAKIWIDRIPLRMINTWDLLEKAFIQRYCPPSKTTKQLEEIHNFKQEGDETLYQAWESSDEIAAITSKLDSLGRDIKKLKENVHAIQVGCGLCSGTHLDKEWSLNEEVKGVEEVKYGESGRSFPINGGSEARYRIAKKQSERDDWLKKFQENTKMNLKHHDETIRTLDDKLGNLTNEVQTQVAGANIGHCKAISTNKGLPLYTPFDYSSDELNYFSAKAYI